MTFKKIFPWGMLCLLLFIVAAVSHQVMGPTSQTTNNAIVRWKGTTGWQTTNSSVTVADNGDVSGVNNLSISQGNFTTIYVTNGFIYLQKTAPPLASDIGGVVGSVTNHEVIDINGALMDYWSDGTTLFGPKQLAP